jgi:HD-GYP domain-containing protein (c-di-GMP phosphodiesterase class II)
MSLSQETESQVQRYLPVKIQSLKDCFKELPVDLFIEMNGRHVRAFEAATGLDFGRLTHYETRGVQYLYFKIEDQGVLDRFFAQSPMMSLSNDNAPIELRRKAFLAVMEQSLFETFSSLAKSSENNQIYKAFDALKHGIKTDKDFLTVFATLLKAAPADNLFLKHAVSTALYTHIIASLAKMSSPRTTKILLFASLFHDLGKVQLDDQVLHATHPRSKELEKQYCRHPELTIEMMRKALPFGDDEVRRCILQHRERIDGRGYPNGLRGAQVYAPARILAIADAFSERLLGLEDGNRYSKAQALAEMRADEGHYDTRLLTLFSLAVTGETLKKAA